MKIVILGLRRSGTTAFWKAFRNDPALLCFDEPFSHQLMRLPEDHPKKIFKEYIDLFDRTRFWDHYAPIGPHEELIEHLTEPQRLYLAWLLDQETNVVIDVTRCNLKIAEIASMRDDILFVHLHRCPQGFVSSHMIPSRNDLVGRVKQVEARRTFWTRPGGFNNWGMETLYSTTCRSKFGELLDCAGFDVERCYELPAAGKLLVMWNYYFLAIEDQLGKTRASHISINFDDFTRDPGVTLTKIYAKAGLAPTSHNTAHIDEASPGFAATSDHWTDLWRLVKEVMPGNRTTEPII